MQVASGDTTKLHLLFLTGVHFVASRAYTGPHDGLFITELFYKSIDVRPTLPLHEGGEAKQIGLIRAEAIHITSSTASSNEEQIAILPWTSRCDGVRMQREIIPSSRDELQAIAERIRVYT